MKRRFLALGGALLLAAGCSGSHRATSPPTSATAPDPYAVPAVITVAYVNSVLAALDHVYSNATRALAAAHAVTAEVSVDLRAIFNDPLYAQQIQAAQLSLKGAIKNVRANGGDARITVIRLIGDSNRCIFVESKSDPSRLFIHPVPEAASQYFELLAKQPGADPTGLNPTPWAFAMDEAFLTPTTLPNKCASSSQS